MKINNSSAGFSVVGLMMVVIVIAALSATVYFSVRPEKRFVDTKNAVRLQDTTAIEKAIKTALLSGTSSPSVLTDIAEDTYYVLINSGSVSNYTCTELGQDIDGIDISETIKPYLGGEIPLDPEASGDNTEYYLVRKGNLFDVGYCNWSRETGSEVVESNSPPVVSNTGRIPSNGAIGVGTGTDVSWTAWTDPDGDIVEYYVTIYKNTSSCTGSYQVTPAWTTATTFDTGIMQFETTYYWQLKARSQGQSDDTAYNDCYSFTTKSLEF